MPPPKPKAENDAGEGLSDEGLSIMRNAISRNQYNLYIPGSLEESIRHKFDIFSSAGIDIFINIGGNQSALGGCTHASGLPNGLYKDLVLCNDPDRGLIQEMIAKDVPVINLLNIKDLASNYGIDLLPGVTYSGSTKLFIEQEVNKNAVLITLLVGILSIIILFPLKNFFRETVNNANKF